MLSDIQNFYRNKTVFVTGGTGFMGIVLVEKLLRITEVKRIYLMLRPKGNKSVEERLTHLFESTLFDKIRKSGVTPTDRIRPILGDCAFANLDISPADRKVLIDEVNIVVHLAATVRFDEPLTRAVNLNVRATLDLIQLAKEMKQLEAFLHVSSAFANCVVNCIDEEYYNAKIGISAVKMCEVANSLGVDTTNKLANVLCKEFPNTYTFTKSLAEEAILSEGRSLPISIFRPAIVIQTSKEPISGWIGNYYGPSAALYAAGRGVLRVMYMKSHHRAHLVPADLCANLMLAIGWETAKSTPEQRLQMAPPIYNYTSEDDNALIWKEYIDTISEYVYEVAISKMIWYPFMIAAGQKWLYYLLTFFYHTIPGYIIDFLLVLKGKKKRMTKLYNIMKRQTKVFDFFLSNEFTFTMDNTKTLWSSLSEEDKQIFNFDLNSIYWKEYLQNSLKGLRLYLGREGPETLPKAQKLHRRFFILNWITHALLFGFLLYLLWVLATIILP